MVYILAARHRRILCTCNHHRSGAAQAIPSYVVGQHESIKKVCCGWERLRLKLLGMFNVNVNEIYVAQGIEQSDI